MKLFTLSGIPVTLRWDAILTPLVIFLLLYLDEGYHAALTYTGPVVLMLWFSILWHEFGHALEAQRHGRPVLGISLWALGGVAVLGEPEKSTPQQDLQIIAAGPLSSIFLAGLGLWLAFIPIWYCVAIGAFLFAINIVLAIFNLFPIFPMDGGRILVSILQILTGEYVTAIRTGTKISISLVYLWVVSGL